MFAMLRGAWPRVTSDGVDIGILEAACAAGHGSVAELEAAVERLVAEVVAAQVASGMGLVTDGSVRWADPVAAVLRAFSAGDTGPDGMLVRAWRATAALTEAPVAAVIPGPCTLAAREGGTGQEPAVAEDRADAFADALAGELAALGEAGCAVIVVDEPAAVDVGADATVRGSFVRAHRRLLADAEDQHTMLAVTGGSALDTGPEALFGLAYNSYLFDLVEGPDNWHLVRAAPGERGIVCAAMTAARDRVLGDQAPQLVWAAQYAASSNGRGLDRVGLANASSLAGFEPAVAVSVLLGLGRAARLAELPLAEAVRQGLDPRAIRVMPGAPPPAPPAEPEL